MSITKGLLNWRNRRIFFVYEVIAKQIKVSAIDEASGVEVSVFGHVNTPKEHLHNVAMTKLFLEIKKKQCGAKPNKSPYGKQVWNSGWE